MRILVVNAGSSSVKLRVLDQDSTVVDGQDLAASAVADGSLGQVLDRIEASGGRIDAVGHRIVHGGTDFVAPTVVDATVRRRLGELGALAPLHQARSLAALDAVGQRLSDVPSVACFDTAFHAQLPAAASTYPLPALWRERYGLRKFGFHGLSHAYNVRRSAELAGLPVDGLRIVSCHLGAGASLAAVVGGRSVDTTMGFTPLDGLVMGTRSGSVDPGLILWLQEVGGLDEAEISDALEHRSGLVALCGTQDLREIQQRIDGGDQQAAAAIEVYIHRLVTAIGGMAVAAGGIDVLSFTGGVGENSELVRTMTAQRLRFLGVDIIAAPVGAPAVDVDISAPEAAVRTLVIRSREDLTIADEVRAVLVSCAELPPDP